MALALALLALGCAGPNGKSVHKDASPAPDSLQRSLDSRIRNGDRAAILDLAMRLEEGTGLPADAASAARLYERVMVDPTRRVPIYSPPSRPGGPSGIVYVAGAADDSLATMARRRLGAMLLEGRGVRRDERRGRTLLGAAAVQGD